MNQGKPEIRLNPSHCITRLIRALSLLVLLILPPMVLAGGGGASTLQRADLATPEQFLEYATANEMDVHEVYFDTMLYEGTESCLMCHEEEGKAAL